MLKQYFFHCLLIEFIEIVQNKIVKNVNLPNYANQLDL